VPYGTKSPDVVTQYSIRNARLLVEQDVEMLVVACNTASAVALPALRAAFDIPVLGVVEPGARAAARVTRTGRVGVLGTQSTVASGAYQRSLAELIPGVVVTARACPLFVPLAEEGWTSADDEVVRLVARRYLAPVREAGVDTVVLGCTHYPLLAGAIAAELPGVTLVDSAAAVAAEVAERFPAAARAGTASHAFFVTDTPNRFLAVAARFLGRPVTSARHVDV